MRHKSKLVVEACRWQDTEENRDKFSRWFASHGATFSMRKSKVVLPLEGIVEEGEWVLWEDFPGLPGRFWLMDDENFSRLYESLSAGEHSDTYRCKLIVEAIRWADTSESKDQLSRWLAGHGEELVVEQSLVILPGHDVVQGEPDDNVASVGEWVVYEDIPGQDGEFYSLDDETFSKTFEVIP